jgi:hypothetical protein
MRQVHAAQVVPSRMCLVQSVVLSRHRQSCYGSSLVVCHIASTFLHPFAPPALPGFVATMGALTPGRPSLRILMRDNELRPGIHPGLLVSCIEPSRRSISNHLLPPPRPDLVLTRSLPRGLPTTSLTRDQSVIWASPLGCRLATNNRPNRVRYPMDRRFTSSCSPPPLTRTQFLSITKFRSNFGKDFHLLI